jgi:hypothetical protein
MFDATSLIKKVDHKMTTIFRLLMRPPLIKASPLPMNCNRMLEAL